MKSTLHTIFIAGGVGAAIVLFFVVILVERVVRFIVILFTDVRNVSRQDFSPLMKTNVLVALVSPYVPVHVPHYHPAGRVAA